jgi:steroid 5-alpha reductase family enzyme
MNFLFPLLAWLAALIGMMTGLWLLQRRTGNAGIVDVGWALGLGLSAIFYAFVCTGDSHRRILVGLMGGGWGLRLAGHLLFDRVLGHPEEGRYVKLRQDWGPAAQRNLFLFFQAQALVAALLSFPFLLAAQDSKTAGRWADLAAPALWLLALAGESLADRQLAAFKARPENRGKTCRAGLWRYSRHPNYFF